MFSICRRQIRNNPTRVLELFLRLFDGREKKKVVDPDRFANLRRIFADRNSAVLQRDYFMLEEN